MLGGRGEWRLTMYKHPIQGGGGSNNSSRSMLHTPLLSTESFNPPPSSKIYYFLTQSLYVVAKYNSSMVFPWVDTVFENRDYLNNVNTLRLNQNDIAE